MARKISVEDFLDKLSEQKRKTFKFQKDTYVNMKTPMKIECPEHGVFEVKPFDFLRSKTGCKKCSHAAMGKRYSVTSDEFLVKARKKHKEKYVYDLSDYKNLQSKISVTCDCGRVFTQKAEKHMSGYGCKICLHKRYREDKTIGDGYYKVVNDKHAKVTIVDAKKPRKKDVIQFNCEKHGIFTSSVDGVMKTVHGCASCSCSKPSVAENELASFVLQFAPVVRSDRKILDGRELDIYVPSKALAIEYCGLYWHTEEQGKEPKYHWRKWKDCKEQGIHLVTVFSDEDEVKVKNAVSSLLGHRERGLPARKLDLKEVGTKEAKEFLDTYHLQGNCGKKVTLGLYDQDTLVAAMAFGAPSRQSTHAWELRRFTTDDKTHAGAASRLWKAFVRKYDPVSVVSLSDRRWFTGKMYETLGFSWDGKVPPDYSYVKGTDRYHKSGFRRAGIKSRIPEFYSEDKTEKEMMKDAGYARIWDCGKDRWVWNNGEKK